MAHIVYVSPGRHSKDDLRVEKEIVLYLISRVTSRVVETEWILESALAWYSRSAESVHAFVPLSLSQYLILYHGSATARSQVRTGLTRSAQG